MTKTAEQTPYEERIFMPKSLDEAYRDFPGVGRKIRIEYHREYKGGIEDETAKPKKTKRWGKVVQKVRHCEGSYFTVELIPEGRQGKRGRYRLSFQFVDLITGRVKLLEVR